MASSNLTCSFCKQPIEGAFFRFQGKDTCERCGGQIQNMRDGFKPAPADMPVSWLVGLATAIGFAGAWGYCAMKADRPLGIIGIFAGFVVTFVTMKAIGDRRGRGVQVACIVCSILAIYLGKSAYYALSFWNDLPQVVDRVRNGLAWPTFEVRVFSNAPQPLIFTLLWFAVAIYDARRRTQPLHIPLEGPYQAPAGANPASLSFDRADFHNESGKSE